jgi:osmotically-inducible protein OsmY
MQTSAQAYRGRKAFVISQPRSRFGPAELTTSNVGRSKVVVLTMESAMSDRKVTNVLAVILGCSMLAAGTTVTLAADDSSAPSDAQITHDVMQKLTHEMPDKFVGLKVETQNGVVTLSGRADTGLSKLQAEQDARKVRGVTDVKDNLLVTM